MEGDGNAAKWTLAVGEWTNNLSQDSETSAVPRPFSLIVDAVSKNLKGEFATGSGSSTATWTCERETKEYRGSPMYSGLVNMRNGLVNVCYQNSLLQCLFHTDQLRAALCQTRQVLAASIPSDPEQNVPGGEAKSSGGIDSRDSIALSRHIFGCVQMLFARLLVATDSSQATHVLQDLITPTYFERNKQQDSHSVRVLHFFELRPKPFPTICFPPTFVCV